MFWETRQSCWSEEEEQTFTPPGHHIYTNPLHVVLHTQIHTHTMPLSVALSFSRGPVISEINDSNKQQQEDAGWLAKAIRLFIRFIGTKTQFSVQQKPTGRLITHPSPSFSQSCHRKPRRRRLWETTPGRKMVQTAEAQEEKDYLLWRKGL